MPLKKKKASSQMRMLLKSFHYFGRKFHRITKPQQLGKEIKSKSIQYFFPGISRTLKY